MTTTNDHTQQAQPGAVIPAAGNGAEGADVAEAAIPVPAGLQKVSLTVPEAEAIRKILDDENHSAYEGKEMPSADASVLRRKN